ncbi:MAG: putative sugar O-methyltransferase [Acidimicrobiia bacterium]
MDLSKPSQFWERLGSEHAAELDRHGFANVKRVQGLRYFNWRWRPGRLAGSEQFSFLLRHARPRDLRAVLRRPLGASDSAWDGVEWSMGERRAYIVAVRLLWRYATRHGDPAVISLAEPELGAPLPVHLDGRLISQDLANAALEVAAMKRALGDRQPGHIVEVGGGYGRSAYGLLHAFPDARYTIVDIEPAASISRWYMNELAPGRVVVISPEQALELDDGAFDLAVSISSLHEMRLDQIDGYLSLFDRVGAGGVVYLKQWTRWDNPVDGVRAEFADYPIPSRWRRLLYERCPVQTHFTQAAWEVPPDPA